MHNFRKLLSVAIGIVWSGLATISSQLPVAANDDFPLCRKAKMSTEVAISTEDFYAAICSKGHISRQSQCYIATDFFYLGQSRKTGESIRLTATEHHQESPFLMIYKARNGEYTYQIASSGAYADKSWTSLSVFKNGKRIYHRKVNTYYGYYDC